MWRYCPHSPLALTGISLVVGGAKWLRRNLIGWRHIVTRFSLATARAIVLQDGDVGRRVRQIHGILTALVACQRREKTLDAAPASREAFRPDPLLASAPNRHECVVIASEGIFD